jgi:hypothetical protein
MSVEPEREFLEPWAEAAADGGMLIVAPLRAALAQQLGRPVTHSVIYRVNLLERYDCPSTQQEGDQDCDGKRVARARCGPAHDSELDGWRRASAH